MYRGPNQIYKNFNIFAEIKVFFPKQFFFFSNSSIGGLNSSIGGLNSSIGGLNSSIGGLNFSIGGLNSLIGGLNWRTQLEDSINHPNVRVFERSNNRRSFR